VNFALLVNILNNHVLYVLSHLTDIFCSSEAQKIYTSTHQIVVLISNYDEKIFKHSHFKKRYNTISTLA